MILILCIQLEGNQRRGELLLAASHHYVHSQTVTGLGLREDFVCIVARSKQETRGGEGRGGGGGIAFGHRLHRQCRTQSLEVTLPVQAIQVCC